MFSLFSRSKSPPQSSSASTSSSSSSSQTEVNPPNKKHHNSSDYTILYQTYSLCPICAFVQQKGFESSQQWKLSKIVNRKQQVYQLIECEEHGTQTLLLCSSVAFFDRCVRFSPGPLDQSSRARIVTHGTTQQQQQQQSTNHANSSSSSSSSSSGGSGANTNNKKLKKNDRSGGGSSGAPPLVDIEDLELRLTHHYAKSNIMNTPFMVDCNLYVHASSNADNASNGGGSGGGGYFVSDQLLNSQLGQISNHFEPKKNFVLKLNAQLVPLRQMNILNERVQYVLNMTEFGISEQPIVLECTFDRLSQLAKLENTVLLNQRIYPSVQIYMEKGRESQSTQELRFAFENLRKIQNLQVIVRLVVSKPMPDLRSILQLLRFDMVGFTRFIILEMERTPSQLMKQFQPTTTTTTTLTNNGNSSTGGSSSSSTTTTVDGESGEQQQQQQQDVNTRFDPFEHVHQFEQTQYAYSLDPLELLNHIQQATDGQVAVSDFYPASTGMILEPFLRMLGKGNYCIRPSPFCGFGALLINTEEQFKSVPVSRLFNIENLYKHMVPLVKKLEKSNGAINLLTGHALKKAINSSVIPKKYRMDNYDIPSDFVSYLTADDKLSETTELMDKVQFLIIHNKMDVCSIDMTKRSRCTMCSHVMSHNSENGKLVAQCTRIL